MRVREPAWIPEPLGQIGPGGLAWWQWIAIFAAVIGAVVVGAMVAAIMRSILRRVVSRSAVTWDDQLLHRLDGPVRMLSALAALRIALPWIELPPAATETITSVLYGLLGVGLAWAMFGAIDIVTTHMASAAWVVDRPASRSLLVIGGRIAKALVIAIALIALLGGLGVPIASLVAGLGIGGIALAFGAQKSVENLFGAFSLGVDQPLREGDFVRIEDQVLGTVEQVGLRSTRFRTLGRTVVTLPNGKLADMRIETFARRDRIMLATTLGLVYSTTRGQIDQVLSGCERVLRSHHGIWPDTIIVRFAGFGASSLDIEVMAWFVTTDYDQFRDWRQEVLLGFMEVVEHAGTSFAFPTRTIHIESMPPGDREPRARP